IRTSFFGTTCSHCHTITCPISRRPDAFFDVRRCDNSQPPLHALSFYIFQSIFFLELVNSAASLNPSRRRRTCNPPTFLYSLFSMLYSPHFHLKNSYLSPMAEFIKYL